MVSMTSRERVLKAAAHQSTDRIPVDYCTRTDVMKKLAAYLGVSNQEELFQKLGIDVRRVGVGERHPCFQERAKDTLGGESENSGRKYIFHEDGSYENAWGILQRLSKDGLYNEWVGGPFADTMDLDAFDWPGMDIFDPVETIKKRVETYQNQYAVMGMLNYPFKICWQMRGLENYLCDMLTEPVFAKELLLRVASYEKEKGIRLARAGVDIIGLSGDIAMQDRMMVHTGAWREIDKPVFADMIRAFKREKPDVLVYYHTDGNMEEVIPDLIEIGVDMINPVQPECMDVEKIVKKYGKQITLHGTISIQRTLPYGTREDVSREVRNRMNCCGQDGGIILAPSNHVQNDTPLENIVEVYRAAGSFQAD